MWVDFDVRGQQRMNFFTAGSIIMNYELNDSLTLNGFVSYEHSFSLHKTLTDELEWCGLLWCFL